MRFELTREIWISQAVQWSPVFGAAFGLLIFIAWRFGIGFHPAGARIPIFQSASRTDSLRQFTVEARARGIWTATMAFLLAAILAAITASTWMLYERDIASDSSFLITTTILSLITMSIFCVFRWGG